MRINCYLGALVENACSIKKPLYLSELGRKAVLLSILIALPFVASNSDIIETKVIPLQEETSTENKPKKWFYAGKTNDSKIPYKNVGIPYHEFMSADSTIVQSLENVALHSTHLFVDPDGNHKEIYLPIATIQSQTGNFFNYISHTNMLQQGDKEILENVVNSCGDFINTDTTSSIPFYINWAEKTLQNCGVMVGLNEIEQKNERPINIYPNPSASGFNLSSTRPLSNIEFYNISGQRVFSYDDLAENNTLYLNIIEQRGLYIFRAMCENEIFIKKLVKK